MPAFIRRKRKLRKLSGRSSLEANYAKPDAGRLLSWRAALHWQIGSITTITPQLAKFGEDKGKIVLISNFPAYAAYHFFKPSTSEDNYRYGVMNQKLFTPWLT
jgi:hypothetical protein